MPHRIGHFERIYRVSEPQTVRLLESVAKSSLLAEYEHALARVLADSAEVILIKQVHLRCVSRAMAEAPFRLAKRWGEEMARAVADAVRKAGQPGGSPVVRFPDAAAHAAAFLREVVNHKDPRAWYFAGFQGFLRSSPEKTLEAFFAWSAESSSPILRRLSESGQCSAVLKLLDRRAAAGLWKSLSHAGEQFEPQADQPLFAAAVALLERTGPTSLSQARTAALWDDWQSSRPTHLDWNDPAILADRLVELLEFLSAKLKVPRPVWNEAIAAELRHFDWVDRKRVQQRLATVSKAASDGEREQMAHRRRTHPGPTPRQRDWQRVFEPALAEVAGDLSLPLNSPANRLLILAEMIRREPRWESDAGLPNWIEQTLANRRASGFSDLGTCRTGANATAAISVRANPLQGHDGAWSNAAGAILLIRGMCDLRAGALGRQCGFPRADALGTRWLLAALAAKCAGVPVCEDDGLRLLAGIDGPEDEVRFTRAWETCTSLADDFQMSLYRLALGHRLIRSDRTRIVMLPQTSDWLLLAGDEQFRVWPLTAVVSTFEQAALRIRSWHSAWTEFGDSPPTLFVPPAMSEHLADLSLEVSAGVPEMLPGDLETFAEASLGSPTVDAAITGFAGLVLRAWARWLKGFADAGPTYLLTQFLRRPGRISIPGKTMRVILERAPLDVVLELAGYFDPLEMFAETEPFERIEFDVLERD